MSAGARPREDAVSDVCLILEGTYPYVFGGVSTWVHELIQAHPERRFHLISIMPPAHERRMRFELPGNVSGHTDLVLSELPRGATFRADGLFARLEHSLEAVTRLGDLDSLRALTDELRGLGSAAGQALLLDSRDAWAMLVSLYERGHRDSSFLDFFWSFRAIASGLYSVLLGTVPQARVYHTISTGYAGLLAARAGAVTGRPVLLTEHGIYTNERRIEIAMSDWLYERPVDSLGVLGRRRQLKDFWIEMFTNYSRLCYQTASRIITLYRANQQFQLHDGADPEKLMVIPNGIDFDAYAAITREASAGSSVALIGRVVPIKDVKTYIRACALLRESVPELRAFVLGPTEEDEEYFDECRALVRHLGLEDTLEFTGKVKLSEYLGQIDVVVLTSISEAQPLVILEAGAAGIPTVATDVGACREMILGREGESPPLGPGGAITPLSSPAATARELRRLFEDPGLRNRCGEAIRERVRRDYNKHDLDEAYDRLYAHYEAV